MRVDINAYRELPWPTDVDLGHAAHHRDALANERLRVLVDLGKGQHLGLEVQEQNGLIRRIDFLVRRRCRHVRRQLARGFRDCRLHILGGRVDTAVEVELQRDIRVALRARGADRRDTGNGRELLLERRRHRGGHRLGAGARQRRGHLDRREVDVGQIAHRQQAEAHDAEEQDRAHQERREDRAPDEELCVHDAFGGRASMRAPGTSRSWPSVTTRSAGFRPFSTIVSAPSRTPGVTRRDSTV